MRKFLLLCVALLSPAPALAYIGPGLGAGAMGVLVGLVSSVLLAVFVIFWYPIKRLFKKKKDKSTESREADGDERE